MRPASLNKKVSRRVQRTTLVFHSRACDLPGYQLVFKGNQEKRISTFSFGSGVMRVQTGFSLHLVVTLDERATLAGSQPLGAGGSFCPAQVIATLFFVLVLAHCYLLSSCSLLIQQVNVEWNISNALIRQMDVNHLYCRSSGGTNWSVYRG